MKVTLVFILIDYVILLKRILFGINPVWSTEPKEKMLTASAIFSQTSGLLPI